jgi:hypothetical protein
MTPTATIAAFSVALTLLAPRLAVADAVSPAEDAFREGRVLLQAKRYDEACAKFAHSKALEPAPGTLLALAYCQELAGQLASSWSSYRAAAELARRADHPDREAVAEERARALEERLSTITVVVPPGLAALTGISVLRDGVEVEPATWDRPIPTDGGEYSFEARAPGYTTWRKLFRVAAEREKVVVTVPTLTPTPPPVEPAPTARERPPSAATTRPPAMDSYERQRARAEAERQRRAAERLRGAEIAAFTGAAAGIIIGTIFGVLAKSKNDASNSDGHCDDTGCDATGTELRNEALNAASSATAAFAIGGGLAVCGSVLHIMANHAEAGASAHGRAPINSGLTVSIEGSF